MQLTITINQAAAIEWGLNPQQALLLAFIRDLAGSSGEAWLGIDKHLIVNEMPILTDKPDTAYRLLKQLELAGVLSLENHPKTTVVRLTDSYRRGVQV